MKNFSKNKFGSTLVKNVMVSLVLTAAMFFGTSIRVYASGTGSSQSDTDSIFDVAMVIDASGSMKDSDPKENAKEGAKLFLDQTLRDESQVFIIKYDYDAKLLGKGRLTSNDDKQQLKKLIDGIEYPDKGGTDTGEALKLAQKTLEDYGEEGHQKCILLFTDGDVVWVTRDREKNKTANPESIEQCKEVSLWGDKNNGDCPLYILGLNAKVKGDNTISEDGQTLIETLAANSGGKCKVVTNVSQINKFYADIFGEITDSNIIEGKKIIATGKWQSAPVVIPNSSVKKANITMFTSAKVDNVKMIDPDGNEMKFNTTDCVLSREKSYSIVELFNPVKGEWTLKFKAPKGTIIQPNFFFLYDNMVSVQTVKTQSGDSQNAYVNQPVTVEVYLKSNDTKVVDPDVYKDIKGTVKVINTDTDELAFTFDLDFDKNKVVMSGEFTPDQFGTYSVKTTLISDSFHRENGPTEVRVIDRKPETIGRIKDMSILVGKSESLNLTNYFKDTDGLGLTYRVTSSDGKVLDVSASDAKGTLTLQTKQKGSTTITIVAADPADNQATVTFKVKVKTILDVAIPWIILLVFLILILIVILMLYAKLKRLKGYMYIINYTDTKDSSINYGDDYLRFNKGDSSVTLFSLINRFARDVESFNGMLTPSLKESQVKTAMSAVIFTGTIGQRDYSVTISYKKGKNAYVVKLDSDVLAGNKKSISASATDVHILEIATTDGHNITIRFRYTQKNR